MKSKVLINIVSLSVVLCVCIAIRLWYNGFSKDPIVSGDTYGYFLLGKTMLSSHKPFFFYMSQRPPVYPLLLQLPLLTAGTYPTELFSTEFFAGMKTVITIQALLGILAVLLLYILTTMLGFRWWERMGIAILIGTNISLISWEHVLVAESLTVPLLLLYGIVVLQLIRRFSVFGVFALLFISIIGLWLKPLYLYLPILAFPVLFLFWKKRSVRLWIAGGFLVIVGIVGFQLFANRMYHGYTGFTHVSDIAMLGRMLKAHITPPPHLSTSLYYAPYISYQPPKDVVDPTFHFLDSIDPGIIVNPNYPALEDLHQFVLTCLFASPSLYIRSALSDIPRALVWNIDTDIPVFRTGLGRILEKIAYATNVISLGILVLFPWGIYQALRNPTRKSVQIAFLASVSVVQLLLTVLVGYGGYDRLMIGTIPLTCVCVWIYGRQLFGTMVKSVSWEKKP